MKLALNFQLNKYFIKFKNVLEKVKDIDLKSKPGEIKVTWLGHASVCLSFDGKVNLLIDPVF